MSSFFDQLSPEDAKHAKETCFDSTVMGVRAYEVPTGTVITLPAHGTQPKVVSTITDDETLTIEVGDVGPDGITQYIILTPNRMRDLKDYVALKQSNIH